MQLNNKLVSMKPKLQVPACIGKRFFTIPRESPLQKQWVAATGRKLDNFKKQSLLEFCSLHFTVDQFKQDVLQRYGATRVPRNVRVLVDGAVPCIRLGKGPENEKRDEAAMKRAERHLNRLNAARGEMY